MNTRSLLFKFFSFWALTLFSLAPQYVLGQSQDAPKIFVECYTGCDMFFVRNEIDYLHFVRDRQTSDVFIILTRQRTGGGGSEMVLEVQGQGRFEGIRDTVKYVIPPNSADLVWKEGLVDGIKKAALPFLLLTDVKDQIDYTVISEESAIDNLGVQEDDPWKAWVFRIGFNGGLNGEESVKRFNVSGNLNVSKVTEAFKFWVSLRGWYNESNFQLDDNETFKSLIRSQGGSSQLVWSMGDHWSIGGNIEAGTSTFSNFDFYSSIKSGIEYSFWPYAEANKRQLTAMYRIGPHYNNYSDTTIFEKIDELLVRQSFEVFFSQIENWGSFDIELEYNSYLHDLNLMNVSFEPGIEWNIFRGFSFRIGGSITLVRDQINIKKAQASEEEILLQISQLKTNYFYRTNIGFNYRFGSTYNNVVNPRF